MSEYQITSQNLTQPLSLESAVVQVAGRLSQAELAWGHGVDSADAEAAWLVLSACNEPLGQSDYDWARLLHEREIETINKLVEKRIHSRQPLAYLLGETWFAGVPFYIDARALVPRSFIAEWIADRFEPWIQSDNVKSVLDLCCGSGCIGIATALEFGDVDLTLSDLSEDALEVARRNVERHELGAITHLNRGAMFEGIDQRYDLILCNPPYVSSARMDKLPPEYRNEPAMALHAGDDGLDFMRPFLRQVRGYLHDHGAIIVEVGSASFALEKQWPTVAFNWMMTEHDETVLFAMSAAELDQYQSQFDVD